MTIKKCSSYLAVIEAAGWQVITHKSLFGDTIHRIAHPATGRVLLLNVQRTVEEALQSFLSEVDNEGFRS